MKPFKELTIKVFKVISHILLSKKEIYDAIKEYNEGLKNGKVKFSQLIVKNGFAINSPDNKRLSDLYFVALIFRNNKKLLKKVIGQIIVLPMVLGMLTIPYFTLRFIYPHFEFTWFDLFCHYVGSSLSVFIIGIITIPFFDFVNKFEIKIGKTLNNLILFIFLALFYGSNKVICFSILSGYLIIYLLIVMLIIEYFIELLVDAYYFSYKVQVTDALILESSYRLTLTRWEDAIRRKNLRQITLTEIERLSGLMEKDWSSHIIPGDEKTNKWKNNTLIGIATSIRKTKRKLIIPSSNTPSELKTNFESIFEKILKHDLQGLIDEEVPVSRIKKKSRIELLQSFIVAVLPLSISVSMKYCPVGLIEPNYIHLSIIISCIWLLLSALLWLDPNLSDKISAVKSVKDVLKQGDNN